MRLVDVHCHLESSAFAGNLDAIIHDAREAGIVMLITNSITPDQWERSREIAREYDCVEFAMGMHPWYLQKEHEASMDRLYRARELGAVAIGEIGLDRKVGHVPFTMQLDFFEKIIAIAQETSLPVIIHCRGAFNELMQTLKKTGPLNAGGVIHSFSGSAEIARALIQYNMSFSLGGILTYRNSRKREKMLKEIYPDHFLLETDSPDIPPVEKRGTDNVPVNILYNLTAVSEILDLEQEEIANTTTENAKRIFKLKV